MTTFTEKLRGHRPEWASPHPSRPERNLSATVYDYAQNVLAEAILELAVEKRPSSPFEASEEMAFEKGYFYLLYVLRTNMQEANVIESIDKQGVVS